MDRYVDRCIDKAISRNLNIFGAVLIQGPKWCGKTTSASRFANSAEAVGCRAFRVRCKEGRIRSVYSYGFGNASGFDAADA